MNEAAVMPSGETLTNVVWFDAVRHWLARFPMSLIQLAGRIGVGAVFFKGGLLKYNSWEFTVLLFRDEYQVPLLDPAVAARIAMVQELTIPIFLFLGLATRLAAIPLLGMIAVIQTFVYPNAYNDRLAWGSILVLVLTRGPGVFSLDYLIERAVRRRAERAPSSLARGVAGSGARVYKDARRGDIRVPEPSREHPPAERKILRGPEAADSEGPLAGRIRSAIPAQQPAPRAELLTSARISAAHTLGIRGLEAVPRQEQQCRIQPVAVETCDVAAERSIPRARFHVLADAIAVVPE